jgi:hypothetical protein
LNFLKFMVLLQ